MIVKRLWLNASPNVENSQLKKNGLKINKVKTKSIEFGFNNEKAGNKSDHNVRLKIRIINKREKFEYKLCERMGEGNRVPGRIGCGRMKR